MRNLVGASNISLPDSLVIENAEYIRGCLAEELNKYFLVADAEPRPTSHPSIVGYIPSETANSFFLTPCTELQIHNFLKMLEKNTAGGYDDIKGKPIITVADLLESPMAEI